MQDKLGSTKPDKVPLTTRFAGLSLLTYSIHCHTHTMSSTHAGTCTVARTHVLFFVDGDCVGQGGPEVEAGLTDEVRG